MSILKIIFSILVCISSFNIQAQHIDTTIFSTGKKFHVQTGFLQVPDSVPLINVVGLAVDKEGNIYVLHRAGREWETEAHIPLNAAVVLKFSKTGAFINAWGSGLFSLPHMINVDPQNNIWIADVALQQVLKFSQNGTLLQQFGEKYIAGKDAAHFDFPTDVAFANNDDIYVADGYGNSRVIRFSGKGKYLNQWGKKGEAPGEFRIPHSIAFYKNKIYVADRENKRLQVFNTKGKLIRTFNIAETIGRAFSVTVSPSGMVYVSGFGATNSSTLILDKNFNVLHHLPFGGHDIAISSNEEIYLTNENDVVRITVIN